MSQTTMSYTLRMPSNLKAFMDAEACKTGVSTANLVIQACWQFLEGDKPDLSLGVPTNNDSVLLGNVGFGLLKPPTERICGFVAWNEIIGEAMSCGLVEHSKKLDHGNWRKI